MGSDSPVKQVAEGVTAALLNWTKESAKDVARKFRDHKLSFVQDSEVIETAKEQKGTTEYSIFRHYVTDGDLCVLFQMGLTLRKVEADKDKRDKLRERVLKKFGDEGLHIAQFVQNGLFGKYFAVIMERGLTSEQISKEITDLFNNIELTNSYIKSVDTVKVEVETIVTRIRSRSPNTYIISGSSSAIVKCRQVKDRVMANISGYTVESYKTDTKEIYFINKKSIL
ncbi:MAG: hypothetical protein LBC12_00405 [Nitrososphaerota archaeon]|jgi:hypothetical protein|nr:hypothetical protein [Nitrososphaerota archaeon]